MIDDLIRWSLRNRLVVLAVAAAFLVWGSYEATRLPVDVLPDLTAPTVTVLVEGHGMAPTDMEALEANNDVRIKFYKDANSAPPASTWIGCTCLAAPELMLEIECIAVVD